MRRRSAIRIALAAGLAVASAVPAGAVPVIVRVPEVKLGIVAYEKGDLRRARKLLGLGVPAAAQSCRAHSIQFGPDAPERLEACYSASEGYLALGLTYAATNRGDRAYDNFVRALRIRPATLPNPATTPPKVRRIFDAARAATLPADRRPGAIAGLEHRPPLVVVRGNGTSLDLEPHGAWRDGGEVEVLYTIGDINRGAYEARTTRTDGGLLVATIPAGETLKGDLLHYRFEAVSGTGRVSRSRWYPLHVVHSVNDLPMEALRRQIDGPEVDALGRVFARTDASSLGRRPEGVARVDTPRGEIDDGPGGLVGFAVSLAP